MESLAQRLIFLMENLDMKQTELAEKIGISKQSLYKYLHCGCQPRADIIACMAIILHTSADFIVGLTDNSMPVEPEAEREAEAQRENEFFKNYRKLSKENQIRLEERMYALLEEQHKQ